MIIVLKNADGDNRLINTEQIIYSYKREDGFGLIMEGRQEIYLTWREFDQLIEAIAKDK